MCTAILHLPLRHAKTRGCAGGKRPCVVPRAGLREVLHASHGGGADHRRLIVMPRARRGPVKARSRACHRLGFALHLDLALLSCALRLTHLATASQLEDELSPPALMQNVTSKHVVHAPRATKDITGTTELSRQPTGGTSGRKTDDNLNDIACYFRCSFTCTTGPGKPGVCLSQLINSATHIIVWHTQKGNAPKAFAVWTWMQYFERSPRFAFSTLDANAVFLAQFYVACIVACVLAQLTRMSLLTKDSAGEVTFIRWCAVNARCTPTNPRLSHMRS